MKASNQSNHFKPLHAHIINAWLISLFEVVFNDIRLSLLRSAKKDTLSGTPLNNILWYPYYFGKKLHHRWYSLWSFHQNIRDKANPRLINLLEFGRRISWNPFGIHRSKGRCASFLGWKQMRNHKRTIYLQRYVRNRIEWKKWNCNQYPWAVHYGCCGAQYWCNRTRRFKDKPERNRALEKWARAVYTKSRIVFSFFGLESPRHSFIFE